MAENVILKPISISDENIAYNLLYEFLEAQSSGNLQPRNNMISGRITHTQTKTQAVKAKRAVAPAPCVNTGTTFSLWNDY